MAHHCYTVANLWENLRCLEIVRILRSMQEHTRSTRAREQKKPFLKMKKMSTYFSIGKQSGSKFSKLSSKIIPRSIFATYDIRRAREQHSGFL